MNAHQLDVNGVIINTIVVDSLDVFPGLMDAALGGAIGDIWDGLKFTRPVLPKAPIIAAKWESIKIERDELRAEGGVLVGADWFHSDADSRIKWLGLKDTARDLLAGGALASATISIDNEVVQWKTMAGAFVPVTIQMALDVVAAVKVLDKQLFKNAEQHRTLMEASADPASYDYSTGWPTRFI